MSGVKILALGALMLASSVVPALGGSILATSSAGPWPSGWIASPAAQNLASPSYNPGASGVINQGGNSGCVTGLFLGVTGSSSSFAPPQAAPPQAVSTPSTVDAFINFGSGPYSEANTLTTGNAQPFFNSPAFTHLFGAGGPTSADVSNFENEVIATIQKTYNQAGLAIGLTTDPTVAAAHTMSVVSGASWVGNANAIGITDVGHNGFSFIDKFSGATTVDQLATAIGHNLSHELMHAFGIANHPEQSGPYVDAAASTLQTLSDPNTAFSPVAAQLLSTLNFQAVGQSILSSSQNVDGNQILLPDPATVPEPSTVALWTLAGGLLAARRRRRAA